MTVGVVDYEAGNLKSVETALRALGARITVSASPQELLSTDRLIFPGVGDAAAATAVLRARGLDDAIRSFVATGRPVLGICLGSQIVLDASEENEATCLGLISGTARRFPADLGVKVPHIGWNQVTPTVSHPIFEGIPSGASFYFVHSYYPSPDDPATVLAETDYGIRFASAIARENLTAVQFHPEKSGPHGLRMLRNFLDYRG